ncbi:MAG: S-layer homology domain-containing protein, partial [Oscillibacter sp.]|nr:S-layer homology domain-containing protein [Oscillibacter sp.]
MKNRIASLFLVFALLMSLCTVAVARDNRITVQSGGAERFTDVPTSHWAYSYINKVVGSGLFNGKTPTTFEPSNAMTRSQFVMVMARMEGRSDLEGVPTQTRFPDVATTRRAAGPIAWATDEGFVQGFGDGTFKPDSPITRGQFAALIHRYIVAKRYVNLHVLDPEPAQFTDAASVSTAFTADVEYARVHGLLTGYSDGTVRASNPITRAAIAAILARFLDLVTESGYTPLLDGPVIDNGDSNDEPPADVPTEYPDIKMTIRSGTHGTTKIASVLRDGVQVAADDVKPGDVVTISHQPNSGYTVSVRVKDSKGRTVTVTKVNDSTSTFVMPENMPVTVTVTYSKLSS